MGGGGLSSDPGTGDPAVCLGGVTQSVETWKGGHQKKESHSWPRGLRVTVAVGGERPLLSHTGMTS